MEVIHEDADLLILSKPAGLVCHPTRDASSRARELGKAGRCAQRTVHTEADRD